MFTKLGINAAIMAVVMQSIWAKGPVVTQAHQDPFYFSWKQEKNPGVDKLDSDLMVLQRIGSGEILQFLKWWEDKYCLDAERLENIYSGHAAELGREVRFWDSLGKLGQDQLRLSWFRENSIKIMPEYKLFILSRIAQIHSLENQEHSDHGEKHTYGQSEFEGHRQSFPRRRNNAHRRR